MQSTGTDISNRNLPRRIPPSATARASRAFHSRRARRGTAEIETLLVIPIILALMFIGQGLATWGKGRLAGVFNAENEAYTQVTSGTSAGGTIIPASDPLPFDGPGAVLPGLPNRFDEASINTPLSANTALSKPSMPLAVENDKAIFLDPSWHYAAFPIPADQSVTQSWFEAYVGEDHPNALVQSLGLQPSWRP